jgi:dTDP-4-amino-4,6-dideoxygalactose transaminase
MLDSLLKKIPELLRLLTLPYQIGFVQGHYYLNSDQIYQIKQVLHSNNNEEIVSEYEKRMISLIGSGYGMSFAAGRMAFYCLLKSLNVGPGDEVILPGFTCSVMPNAVWRTGATPVFSNVDQETFGSSPSAIKEKITSCTKVIVAQHSFGIPCKVKEIIDIAASKGIFVVEDSAITLGSSINGTLTGNFGNAAIFSTEHSKPLNTLIGGFLYSKDKKVLDKVQSILRELNEFDHSHQERLFKQMLFERRCYYPSRYPRMKFITKLRAVIGKIQKKPTYLENDYSKPESTNSSYSYPAKIPPFLAKLGLFELERWEKEKKRRRRILQQFLKIAGNSKMREWIPAIYADTSLDIVPLRFVYRHPRPEQHLKKMSKYIDIGGTWFRSPVICCPKGLQNIGYFLGSCDFSEKVCLDIVNWPCVVPEEWEEKLLSIFDGVVNSGHKKTLE